MVNDYDRRRFSWMIFIYRSVKSERIQLTTMLIACKFGELDRIVLHETCECRSEISPQRVINNGVSESRWPLLLLVGGILADQGLGNSTPPHSQVARGRRIQSSVYRLHISTISFSILTKNSTRISHDITSPS